MEQRTNDASGGEPPTTNRVAVGDTVTPNRLDATAW